MAEIRITLTEHSVWRVDPDKLKREYPDEFFEFVRSSDDTSDRAWLLDSIDAAGGVRSLLGDPYSYEDDLEVSDR